jgi:hypothetical protein
MLPLVLDDVLVNFDRERAMHAARTLKTFAELGHQVMMFTCHQHIVDIFHEIEVEVRVMPQHGIPGRATVLLPEIAEEEFYQDGEEDEAEYEEETLEDLSDEIEPEPIVEVAEAEEVDEPPQVLEAHDEPEPEPVKPRVVRVELPRQKPTKKKIKPQVQYVAPMVSELVEEEPTYVEEPVAGIGWTWFEREPIDRLDEVEDALASIANHALLGESRHDREGVPDEVLDRSGSWWRAD